MKRNKKPSPTIPFVQALMWIVGSCFVVAGVGNMGIHHFLQKRRLQHSKQAALIRTLIQTGPQREALRTEYLAQLLNLSIDRPSFAEKFDVKRAEEQLLASPLISEAHVKLLHPDTVYVDYTIRQPIAWLSDYENTALDKNGHLFPFRPFFSPKNLPEIYLGLAPFGEAAQDTNKPAASWEKPLEGKQIDLAMKLLSLFSEPSIQELFTLKRIDVSNAYADSYGSREIIVVIEDQILEDRLGQQVAYLFPKIIRLSTKNFAAEMGNFIKLREDLIQSQREKLLSQKPQERARIQPTMTIDLRIANLAFLDNHS